MCVCVYIYKFSVVSYSVRKLKSGSFVGSWNAERVIFVYPKVTRVCIYKFLCVCVYTHTHARATVKVPSFVNV